MVSAQGFEPRTHALEGALLYPAELCTHDIGAGNEIRTRDFNLGKVALYH